MAFTFKEEGTNVAVFDDGKRITTTTPQNAKTSFGFQGDVAPPKTAFQQSQQVQQPTPSPVPTPPAPIESPVAAPVDVKAPTFPEPEAPKIQESFVTGLAEEATRTRAAVEAANTKQIAEADKRINETTQKIQDLEEQQQVLLDTDVSEQLQPFRQELEKTERERLHVTENFEENQKLVNELDTLLTEGNELIAEKRGRFASRASVASSTARAIEDVAARSGVIQAVMSARNGQIAQAFTMIDRSVKAITADRQDRLTYFNTILQFAEGKKGTAQAKLLTLQKDKKDLIKKEVALLERDMVRAEEYAENIKQAMIDPDTALLYAQAGVMLTDSPEAIAEKIGKASYAQEVQNMSNTMALDGFKFLIPGGVVPAGSEKVTLTDSKGVEKSYFKEKSTEDILSEQLARERIKTEGAKRLEILDGIAGQGTATGIEGAEIGTPEHTAQLIDQSSQFGDKRLTQGQLEKIQQAMGALSGIESLNSLLFQGGDNNDGLSLTGPVKGRVRKLITNLGGDVDAAGINSIIQGLIPTVARGIFGEVGVLTDADINNYKKTLANLNNSEDQNRLVSVIMLDVLSRSLENTLITNAQNQTNVSGFADTYESIRNRVDIEKNKLGVTTFSSLDNNDFLESIPEDNLGGSVSSDFNNLLSNFMRIEI